MNLYLILKEFRRHRILIALALLASVGVGVFVVYRVGPGLPPHLASRQYQVGVASERVLVDTHDSIVADLNPSGAASLSVHAQLLGDLLASQAIRSSIATKVGIPQQDLAVVPPAVAGAPTVPTPVATAVPPPSDASTLTISVDSTLPLVTISAQAPTQTRASVLTAGAVSALRDYLASVASVQKIPAIRQPVITSLGAVSGTTTKGPSRVFGAVAALVVFGLLCYLILLVSGVRRRFREGTAVAAEPTPLPSAHQDSEPADEELDGVPAGTLAAAVPNGNASSNRRVRSLTLADDDEPETDSEHELEQELVPARQFDRKQAPRSVAAFSALLNRR
jgi:hypothetical protein